MKISYIFGFIVIGFLESIFAQNKVSLSANLDCASSAFEITKDHLNLCSKFILQGEGSENFTFHSATLTFLWGGTIKEFLYQGTELSAEIKAAIKKLSPGESFYIEMPKAKNKQTGDLILIPNSKIKIK